MMFDDEDVPDPDEEQPILFQHVGHAGETVNTRILRMPLEDWYQRPEHLSTLWQAHIKGDMVTACAVDFVRG